MACQQQSSLKHLGNDIPQLPLFVFSSVVLAIVPGPDMAYMLGRCIAQGRRAGVLAALGFNASSYFYLTTAVLGLSALCGIGLAVGRAEGVNLHG